MFGTERQPRANHSETEVLATANNQNLHPFNTLPLEVHREISRKGGIASGERRRHKADLRTAMIEIVAGQELAEETREEYRAAIKRYVREERKKSARRKRK